MARQKPPDDVSFEAWVSHVFDHPVLDPQWWWQVSASARPQSWDEGADPARTLSYLTRLFRAPQILIPRFTRAQINQGLTYLFDPSCSDHMHVLAVASLPWPDRRACIESMTTLYADLIAPVYGDDLGHTEARSDPERPTYACYMLWDVISLYGGMDHADGPRINDAVLALFERVLKLRAESCLESVLHGLGHWHLYVPDRTEPIVRRFLSRTDISPALRHYAEQAATGMVQ
jgi:hypothetical protein